jgi:hypothetical protein
MSITVPVDIVPRSKPFMYQIRRDPILAAQGQRNKPLLRDA